MRGDKEQETKLDQLFFRSDPKKIKIYPYFFLSTLLENLLQST